MYWRWSCFVGWRSATAKTDGEAIDVGRGPYTVAMRPSSTCFLLAGLCFFLAASSAVVSWLGPPAIFAFATLCSTFLVFGALEFKKEQLAQKRDCEDASGARVGRPDGRS